MSPAGPAWPRLDHPGLRDTLDTLHLWTQVVGKVKLACLPWLNESWHVPLYVSARGLTTQLVTHDSLGFEVVFDFFEGTLIIATSSGQRRAVELKPRSVASFYSATMAALRDVGLDIAISPLPSEIAGAIAFPEDTTDRLFDLEAVRSFWLALIQVHRVFHRFRSRFVGKCSPIHFFWGSFDLAVTRFSGRPAPMVTHGGPNFSLAVARDAYADEQVSCGFWPGGNGVGEPSFYVEAWPSPQGFASAKVASPGARYVDTLGEWVLGYSVVRTSDDPDHTLLEFLQAGYEAVADEAEWNRVKLERPEGPVGRPPPG